MTGRGRAAAWSISKEVFFFLYFRKKLRARATRNKENNNSGLIEKCTKLISIPNFLPPGLQAFRSSLLVFNFLGEFESTKLNSIRKVLDGKVRNFFL